MASTTKYEDILSIPKFYGINQSGDGYNTDLKYAHRGSGFDTRLGDLTPWAKPHKLEKDNAVELPISDSRKATLAFLTKRWKLGQSGAIPTDSNKNKYAFVVTDGNLYYTRSNCQSSGDTPFSKCDWSKIATLNCVNDKFDTLTYELNYAPPQTVPALTDAFRAEITEKKWVAFNPDATYDSATLKYVLVKVNDENKVVYTKDDGTEVEPTAIRKVYEAPVDCLLMTNADDGMYCIYLPLDESAADYKPLVTKVTVQPSGTTEDIKFGCIERYCERIFGSGIKTDNDKIMYCALYDIFNWEQDNDDPDLGAGDIQQPEWNGDRFVSLKCLSSYLLCFKEHSIWKISGDYPSQFYFTKMYGDGTISDGSVAVHGYFAYFVDNEGIRYFDGTGTQYVKYGWLNELNISSYSDNSKDHIFAERWGDYYVLYANNKHIVLYNIVEGTFNLIKSHDDDYLALKEYDGRLYSLIVREDIETWEASLNFYKMFSGNPYDVEWESAWIDLGAKNITKSSFSVYVMFDGEETNSDMDGYSPTPIPLEISIQSEKKTKTKNLSMYLNKPKKININCSGREFKLKFKIKGSETDDEWTSIPEWHMRSGIQIHLEYDYD